MERQSLKEAIENTTLGFSESVLQLPLYNWQAKALRPLERATGKKARLQNIAVCAPNGSGKDDRIIPAASFWWLAMHKRGKVVITSKSDLQLSGQTIPALDRHWSKFAGWKEPTRSPRYELKTPTGGRLVAFVSNSAERVEGWHKEDNTDGPLLEIVNEAKSVDEGIFTGLDRWTVNARMYISSPGLMLGRFYDCFDKLRADWIGIRAGLADCPHIPEERIKYIIATYGENHPITRSTLYGEFMNQDEAEWFCVPLDALVACYDDPPRERKGFEYAFWDFAEGRAENVCAYRNGNKITIEDTFREQNEDAVVGRVIRTCRRLGLQPNQVGGDAAAKSILDKLASAGWVIHRQNFGAPDPSGVYVSWGAKAWIQLGNGIKNREWILPNDEVFKAQATQRKKTYTNTGKLGIEDKQKMMKERRVASPDRADAVVGVAAAVDPMLYQHKTPFSVDGWREKASEGNDKSFLDSIGAGAGI